MSKPIVDPGAEELDKAAGESWGTAAHEASARGLPVTGSHEGRRFRYFPDGPIEDLGPVDLAPVDAVRGENADRQETTPAGSLADHFQVSAEMRAIAENSVEQARLACDGLLGAAHRVVDTFAGQAETAGKGTKGIAESAMTLAEQDIANSFEFARALVRARDAQDVLKLQAEYIKAQMQLFLPRC